MKKLLIAAAALSVVAGAQAQSNVTIYGILDMSYNQIESVGSRTDKITNVGGADSDNGQGNLNGSRLGFRGTEDLGAGKSAGFVVEYGLKLTGPAQDAALATAVTTASNTGAGLGNLRQGFVTLSDKALGTISAGTQYSLVDATGGSLAPSVAHVGTGTSEGAHTLLKYGQTFARYTNAIGYTSPSFNGLTFRALLQPSESAQTSSVTVKSNKAESFAIDYVAGNLVAGIATSKMKNISQDDAVMVALTGANDSATLDSDAAGTADAKYTVYGAKYNFGFANIGLHHSEYENNNQSASKIDMASSQTMLSAAIPLSPAFTLSLGYTDGKFESGTTLAKTYDTTGYDVVGVYTLSKRTNVYALYTQSKFDSATGGQDLKQTRIGAGVRHSF